MKPKIVLILLAVILTKTEISKAAPTKLLDSLRQSVMDEKRRFYSPIIKTALPELTPPVPCPDIGEEVFAKLFLYTLSESLIGDPLFTGEEVHVREGFEGWKALDRITREGPIRFLQIGLTSSKVFQFTLGNAPEVPAWQEQRCEYKVTLAYTEAHYQYNREIDMNQEVSSFVPHKDFSLTICRKLGEENLPEGVRVCAINEAE